MSKLATADEIVADLPAVTQQTQLSRVVQDSPHFIEQEVRRRLGENPHLKIDSLVVRRIDKGICLQGVVESQEITHDICSLAKSVRGVDHVLNRLMVAPTQPAQN